MFNIAWVFRSYDTSHLNCYLAKGQDYSLSNSVKSGESNDSLRAISVQIDLTYLDTEDRMLIKIVAAKVDVTWLLTRKLLLRLLKVWTAKLEEVALPSISDFLPNAPRNLVLEHSLALEFDGPQPKNESAPILSINGAHLLLEINLKLNSIQTHLTLRGVSQEISLSFSRRETHAFIEMLFNKSKQAGWLVAASFPDWLTGHHSTNIQ